MQTFYTIDVKHGRHWYQWDTLTNLETAERLFNEYINDDTFDDVSITQHTYSEAQQLRSKSNEEVLPW